MHTPTVEIRRADDRAKTKISWLDSKHSFAFGSHYQPDNTHHGLLLVNNDDIVTPGTGFETHPHRDMEIVTWVLRGSLVHQDSTGHSGVIYPGLARHSAFGEERLVDPDRRAIPSGASAFRPDVGGPRRVGHLPWLPTARDRRRVAARRPGDNRVGHARTQRRNGHHDPQPPRGAARCPDGARRQRRITAGSLSALVHPPW